MSIRNVLVWNLAVLRMLEGNVFSDDDTGVATMVAIDEIIFHLNKHLLIDR